MRHPAGHQAVLRVATSGTEALAIVHTFANSPREIEIALPQGHWEKAADLLAPEVTFLLEPGKLKLQIPRDFSAAVLHLRRV